MNKKVGRNDPCICGSGKKYKQCCLNKEKEPVKNFWKRQIKVLTGESTQKKENIEQQKKMKNDYATLMQRSFGNVLEDTSDLPTFSSHSFKEQKDGSENESES